MLRLASYTDLVGALLNPLDSSDGRHSLSGQQEVRELDVLCRYGAFICGRHVVRGCHGDALSVRECEANELVERQDSLCFYLCPIRPTANPISNLTLR